MSLNYTAVCKTQINTIGSKFKVKLNQKCIYRKAVSANDNNIFIIDDGNNNRCSFTTAEFKIYFYTEQELRKEKLEKLKSL